MSGILAEPVLSNDAQQLVFDYLKYHAHLKTLSKFIEESNILEQERLIGAAKREEIKKEMTKPVQSVGVGKRELEYGGFLLVLVIAAKISKLL